MVDPSFEIHDTCNASIWIIGCKYWHSLDSSNNISNPALCTPTYANLCSTDPNSSLPDNFATGGVKSRMYPRSGEGLYMSLFYLNPAINAGYNRDYLRGRLRSKLINAKQYCGKYYVSLYKTMIYATDRFGAYLDDGSLDVNNTCLPIVVTPQFENPALI